MEAARECAKQSGDLGAIGLALGRAYADEEAVVGRLVRGAAVVYFEHDYADGVVKRDLVYARQYRGLDLVAAYVYQLFFDQLGVVKPFEAALVVYAEDDRAAA